MILTFVSVPATPQIKGQVLHRQNDSDIRFRSSYPSN